MIIPPTIRFLGDKFTAQSLVGRAKNELRILREQMRLGGLFQATRLIQDRSGWWIRCSACGVLDYISIHYPMFPVTAAAVIDTAVQLAVQCWCACCFAEGEIIEASHELPDKYPHGQRGNWGHYADDDSEVDPYLDVCAENDAAIQNYNGVRYLVKACSNVDEDAGIIDPFQVYCCTATDFAEYETGDKVVLLFRGRWQGENLVNTDCLDCRDCLGACRANRRDELDELDPRADGAFVIFPVLVDGVNEGFTHGALMVDI